MTPCRSWNARSQTISAQGERCAGPDPTKKTVTVYRIGQTTQVLAEKHVLTLEDIILEIKMPLPDAFT
jgi:hypothetical protein